MSDDFLGETIVSTKYDTTNETVVFTTESGDKWRMVHHQDCCESVDIQSIEGDLDSLVGGKVTFFDHVETPLDRDEENYIYSTLTVFELMTDNGGRVTIKWLGESNGYYSESVDFEKMERLD